MLLHCVQCLVESSLKVHFAVQCADDRLYHSTTFKGKRLVHLIGIFWCLKVHFAVQCADDRLYHSTTFKGKRLVHLTGIFQCLSIHKRQYDSTV